MARFTARLLGASMTSGLALLAAAPALAQTSAEAENVTTLEDIVVTARKVSESAQTVPLAITALSGENLRQQSVRTVADVQAQTPNLVLQQHPSEPQALSLAIRGQKQVDILTTLDPSVGLYVDGFYSPRSFGLRGALVDVARLEVLRGPQGTLYGRNTTGGAISLYTNDPTDAFEGSIQAMAGNFEAWGVTGVVNLPLGENLALRLVAEHNEHGGYGHDGLGRELMAENSDYIRAKVKAQLGENVEATLSASYQETHNSGPIIQLAGLRPGAAPPAVLQAAIQSGRGLSAAGLAATVAELNGYIAAGQTTGDIYQTAGTTASFSDFKGINLGLDLKIELTDEITLRSLSGYQELERANNNDYDDTPYTIVEGLRTTDSKYLSQEFQLLGGDEQLNWVLGVYAGHEKATDFNVAPAIPAVNVAAPTTFDGDVVNKNAAVYGQAIWEFVPDWRLTAGLRYSWDDRELTSRNRNRLNPCLVPAPGVAITGAPTNPANGASQCPRTFEEKFSDPSWLISLDHQFSEDVLGYGKIARGYRTGGINLRGANTVASFASFEPETVTEYEVGLKAYLFERTVRLNAAVYYDKYNDIQRNASVPTTTGAPTTVTTNAAKAHVQGVELEGSWRVTPALTISGAFGLMDAKYDEFVDVVGDRTAETFGLPKKTASISARYVHPTDLGDLAFQADYSWRSSAILVPETPSFLQMRQGPYGLLNARVSLALDNWDAEVAVFGKNLTDEEYFVSGGSSERTLGYNYKLVGEPRLYGVEFIKRFGG